MKTLFMIAVILQSVLIAFDEFYFHRRRGLPRWERLGHPIDTFSLLVPFAILAFAEKSSEMKNLYVAFSALSCLCITKDEWIHRSLATPAENWVHAVLFVLHPVVLITGFGLWGDGPVRVFVAGVAGFFIYQIYYWNFNVEQRRPRTSY